MEFLLTLFLLLFNSVHSTYLSNSEANVKYLDVTDSDFINADYTYPSKGFSCSMIHNDELYLVSSTYHYTNWIRQSENYKCTKTFKKVDILKFNVTNNSFMDNLLIEDTSDYVVSCGIDKTLNMLYFINANYYNCPTNYNLDSSIVRVNLNSFSLIDKTRLESLNNVPDFFSGSSSHWDYRYIHSPSTSQLIENNSLWVGFGGIYTGIWRLKINTPQVVLIDYYQKTYTQLIDNIEGQGQSVTYVMRDIKKSFTLNNSIYFLEDAGYKDANLLQLNISDFYNISVKLNENNTRIIKLDGVSYISDIEIDYYRKKIYVVSGNLVSELYTYDYSFNKLFIVKDCDVDFLKFPTQWGVIHNIKLDSKTQILYALISTRHPPGIAKINTKTMKVDENIITFGEYFNHTYSHYKTKELITYTYFRSYTNLNITSPITEDGKLYIAPYSSYNLKKMAIVNLYGCASGFGINSNITSCIMCEPGKYSNTIGSICINCNAGYSASNYESINCDKCESGKYTTYTNNENCLECVAGRYTEEQGSSICKKCSAGKYSISVNSKSEKNCKSCENGEISGEGQTSCTLCEIGKWSKNNIYCENCSLGKYSDSLGLISDDGCINCPNGLYNDELGQTSLLNCKSCPSGKIGLIEGAKSSSVCVLCSIGKFKSSSTTCSDCPAGYITNLYENKCDLCEIGKWASNVQSCIDCGKGTYSYITGLTSASECILCEMGKYQNQNRQTTVASCIECPNGKIGVIEGAKSNNSCILCEIGKYKSTLTICSDCPAGYITNLYENKCDLCEVGKWASNAEKCVSCPKGKYSFMQYIVSVNDCKNCEKGKYQDEVMQITENSCKSCPEGKIGRQLGAISNSSCIFCEAGKFRKFSDKCVNCPSGYVSTYGSNICNICGIGKISDNYGLECKNCQAGRYNDLIGLSERYDVCKNCLSGKYNSEIGSINPNYCKDCPSGKYGKGFGLVSINFCINCEEGKYNNRIGQSDETSCIQCIAGRWNNKMGSNSSKYCVMCEPGLYGEKIGSKTITDCKMCPHGRFNENSGLDSINDCKICPTGTYSTKASIRCLFCNAGKYVSTPGSSSCLDCREGTYTSKPGSFICNECKTNSEQNYDKTGCVCSTGSYMSLTNTSYECLECSKEFICRKNTRLETLELKQHFWRENNQSIVTYKCKNIFACKGGIIGNNSDDLCQLGHKGPLCDVCEKDWAKDDNVCVKCPENKARSIGLTIFIPIVCIILIIFLIKTANPSENKKEEVNGVVKIFMNYAQVFSLASSFQINWPSLIRYLFERAKEFSSPRVSFYSSDCTIGWNYYDKLVVYLVLPIFYMVSVTIIIGIISLCYIKKKNKVLKNMSDEIQIQIYNNKKPDCKTFFIAWEKTAIVVGTFLSWPTIVEKTLEVMNCERIGDVYYLVKDFSVICYTPTHYTFLIISYIAIILYGLGIPMFGFYLLFKYRYRLYDMQNRYDGSTPLSFLFLGYREKRWYYEFIIMGKKGGLILLSVFLRNHPRYQIIGASLLIQISFFFHVFLRPYDTITSYGMICNKLESISLLSLVMTLSTGLFFGTVDSGYQLGLFEDVLIVMLILCNGGIVFYFMCYFLVLGRKTFITHLRDKGRLYFDKGRIPFFVRCCKHKHIQKFKNWVYLEKKNNYGIQLKNEMEKKIFSNYFQEKKSKLDLLNDKIDNFSHRRVSMKLDRLRSQIQVMEKERCWQTIKNNRLYAELKRITVENKKNLSDKEIKQLHDVFKLYVTNGVKYNSKINTLYMSELETMIPDSPTQTPPLSPKDMVNEIIITQEQLEKLRESFELEDVKNIII